MGERVLALEDWLRGELGLAYTELLPLAGDASFRRYFRVRTKTSPLIAMDAPPELEASQPFVDVAKRFAEIGLRVPEIIASDVKRGFLLLSDLGDALYSMVLNEGNVDRHYGNALRELLILQSSFSGDADNFPPYDYDLLMREMQLFEEWYVKGHLGLSLTPADAKMFVNTCDGLAQMALSQPRVCVHRDYHSRNLLSLEKDAVGILDFQDAVWGPVTYDLVSLLRDCYVAWPAKKVEQWVLDYHRRAVERGVVSEKTGDNFMQWFDWMGVQRHLKAIGIFARKSLRDNQASYLADIPRTLKYVLDVTAKHPELIKLHDFIREHIK